MAATPPNTASVEGGVVELEKQCLIQSYARLPLVIVRGKGCYVYDGTGKRYLDFVSGIGVNALGHAHPRILKAIREQMSRLIHCSNLYYHSYQAPLAARLTELTGLDRVFFTNSGGESVEGALKIAKAFGRRQSDEKFEIVALNDGFAGRTAGALSVTGTAKYREPFEPLLPGVRFVDVNDLDGLRAAVSDRTTAILLEPILGEGGLQEVSRDFARCAMDLAKQHNALLIFDEIQSGLGRTGSYFAFQWWHQPSADDTSPEPIQPDVLVTAKPLGGGLPLGCVIANERAAAMITPGLHGTTFGGNALACRAALEFLDVLDEELPAIRESGDYFKRRLEELVVRYDFVEGVRGKGLMVGLNLKVPGKAVVQQAMEMGLLINCTTETVLRFLPPYIIERRHIDQAVTILDKIFQQGPPQAAA